MHDHRGDRPGGLRDYMMDLGFLGRGGADGRRTVSMTLIRGLRRSYLGLAGPRAYAGGSGASREDEAQNPADA